MTAYAYLCQEMIGGELGETVGAANDVASAVEIACAYFVAKQSASVSSNFGVIVLEGATAVAQVGASDLEVGIS